MAVSCVPPIVMPMHYDASFKVDVLLHQPLLARGVTPADIRLEMMSLCSQLETLCSMEEQEQSSGRTEHGHVSSSFRDRATVVCDRALQLMGRIPGGSQDLTTYIESRGLNRLFPRAAAYFVNQRVSVPQEQGFDIAVYYSSLTAYSNLSTLARQIHNDCADPSSQKYIAHQLAILYQLVSSLKSTTFSQHKQSIEANFKSIKSTLGGSGTDGRPRLTPEQQEWMLNLTSNIITTISEFPAELMQDLIAPATVLQKSP